MKLAAQGGHGVSPSGDLENLPGPILVSPALEEGLDKMVSRGPFQPSCFYDSVIHSDPH